jgi:hypothetical protein
MRPDTTAYTWNVSLKASIFCSTSSSFLDSLFTTSFDWIWRRKWRNWETSERDDSYRFVITLLGNFFWLLQWVALLQLFRLYFRHVYTCLCCSLLVIQKSQIRFFFSLYVVKLWRKESSLASICCAQYLSHPTPHPAYSGFLTAIGKIVQIKNDERALLFLLFN